MGILLPLRLEYLYFYLATGAVCLVAYWLAGPISLILVSVPSWMALVAYHAFQMDKELKEIGESRKD
jgi:membrane associated rhomboid family serine protease